MQNPDPKKYVLKKLRGKGYCLVDRQILEWRKKRKNTKAETDRVIISQAVKTTLFVPEPPKPHLTSVEALFSPEEDE